MFYFPRSCTDGLKNFSAVAGENLALIELMGRQSPRLLVRQSYFGLFSTAMSGFRALFIVPFFRTSDINCFVVNRVDPTGRIPSCNLLRISRLGID